MSQTTAVMSEHMPSNMIEITGRVKSVSLCLSTQCCLAPVIKGSTWEKSSRMYVCVGKLECVCVRACMRVCVCPASQVHGWRLTVG